MSLATARQVFGFSHWVATRNLAGLDHATSLRSPGGANCANWLLGHILSTRGVVFSLIGQPPVLSPEEAAPYRRGSHAGEDSAWLPFEELALRFEQSQARLLAGLESLTGEDWERITDAGPFEQRPLRELVVFFALHESYHAGQLGSLRQPLGLGGAIA